MTKVQTPLAVVIGALNLDIIITGLPKFAQPGEQVNGESIDLSPGGKGRNIAAMLASWLAPGQVSMISKLVRDRYDLYRIPLQSMLDANINTDYIKLEADRPDDLPTLAIFLNTIDGQRANYYLPGQNETLSQSTLENTRPLIKQLAENNGFLIFTLEMPMATACHALSLAEEVGLRVMLDPGGQPPQAEIDFSPLFEHPIFLIKPNELEATLLTGISVDDFSSAGQAARVLLDQNVQHVLITHGMHGAYAFTGDQGWHIPPPSLSPPPQAESTGCGDQVLAVLCAEMLHGAPFESACQKAVTAGSLQYCQVGLSPIQPDDPLLP
mgnify:CR=1 FL=1